MDTELIWAAGLFVGEGSVWTSGRGYLGLGLMMLDRVAVERFAAALTPHMPPRFNYKMYPAVPISVDRGKYHRVHLGGTRAFAAANLLLPHMEGTAKGEQVSAALALHA
jgi:hypothetical protein